jgi:hypothetical protein
MSVIGPQRTSCDVRFCAAIGGKADSEPFIKKLGPQLSRRSLHTVATRRRRKDESNQSFKTRLQLLTLQALYHQRERLFKISSKFICETKKGNLNFAHGLV